MFGTLSNSKNTSWEMFLRSNDLIIELHVVVSDGEVYRHFLGVVWRVWFHPCNRILTERTATLASLGKQFQTKPVKLALQDRRKEKERVKERDRKDRDRNDKVPRTLQFHRQITHRLEHFFLHGLCNGEHFFGFWALVA